MIVRENLDASFILANLTSILSLPPPEEETLDSLERLSKIRSNPMAKTWKPKGAFAKVTAASNIELLAMAAEAKIWPEPSLKKVDLKRLHDEGYLLREELGEWKAPGRHRVPSHERWVRLFFLNLSSSTG